MKEKEPRGVHTFTTQKFSNESDAIALAIEDFNRTVCELQRLFDEPSDWLVIIPND